MDNVIRVLPLVYSFEQSQVSVCDCRDILFIINCYSPRLLSAVSHAANEGSR